MHQPLFPNLFIVGQPKAGTTSLTLQLAQHPDIFAPERKEPHFMCREEPPGWYYYRKPILADPADYLALYKNTTSPYRIDASVHYLRFESAARLIKKHSPDAKIVIVLREPIQRMISHYLMDVRAGLVDKDINTLLREGGKHADEYIHCSLASVQVDRYLKLFGEDNVFVMRFDGLVNENARHINSLIDFLGVSQRWLPPIRENTYRLPKGVFKPLYRLSSLRRVYRFLVPHSLRRAMFSLIFNETKPNVEIDLTIPGVRAVIDDYAQSLANLPRLRYAL